MEIDLDIKSIKQGPAARRPKPVVVDINYDELKSWEETRTLMLLTCPAFSHILYSMMNPYKKSDVAYWTMEIPIAATDGVALLLNPKKFFIYTLGERVFIVAHEICHNIFNHCGMMQVWVSTGTVGYSDGTFLPYNDKLMNVAADLVINAMLIAAKVGKYNPNWLYRPEYSRLGEESVIDVYRKIYKEQFGDGGGGEGKGKKPGQPGGTIKIPGESFDEHLAPGTTDDGDTPGECKNPTEAMQDRNDAEWKTEVAAAMAAAKAQGKLPASLDRIFGELLTPVVSWKDHVMAFLARKVGGGGYNWRDPDRDLIVRGLTPVLPWEPMYAPSRSGFGCGTIVVVGDTSGSIDYRPGRIGDKFLSEIGGILEELRPKRIVVIWCDADVGRVDEVEDASDIDHIRYTGVPGGGGTSFVPPFEEVAKMGLTPDALIYLTDGYGTFPEHEPSYPVLWGSITDVKYPFGDVVDLTELTQ